MLFDESLFKVAEFPYLENSLYPSIIKFVEAMNTQSQQRHNHAENNVTVKVSRKTQKFRITCSKCSIWSWIF